MNMDVRRRAGSWPGTCLRTNGEQLWKRGERRSGWPCKAYEVVITCDRAGYKARKREGAMKRGAKVLREVWRISICETCGRTTKRVAFLDDDSWDVFNNVAVLVTACDGCASAWELYARHDHKVYAMGAWLTGMDALRWWQMFHSDKPGEFATTQGRRGKG